MSERFKSAGEAAAKDGGRSRSRLFAKPEELLVEEHPPRILMPVPPPRLDARLDEEDAFARLHSIDAEPDEEISLSTGPLRVFVGPPDNRSGGLRIGAREEVPLPAAELPRPRMAGISLREDSRPPRDEGRRQDSRPMSAAARSTGLAEDLLRTEIPFDLLGEEGDLPPPRVGKDSTSLPTIKRNGAGIQVRLRGAPPPPAPAEDPDVLAAGSEEDEEFASLMPSNTAEEAFPTLPELPIDTPAIEPPRVLTRPAPEPSRSKRPNLFEDAAPAGPSRTRPQAPPVAPPATRWWIAAAAAALALGFGVWRWESTHPGSILALGAALRPSPTIAIPNAATAVAPPSEVPTVAAPSAALGEPATTTPPPLSAPEAPTPPPSAPAAVPAVNVDVPPVEPTPPAPTGSSDRRQSFKMPTGRILIVCDRKATIYVDNVKKGLSTDQRPIELTAGNHTVRLVAGGRSKTQQVRVDSEELRMIQFKF